MKKLFLTATICSSILANNAFAKTQGSYLGVDALSVRTSFYSKINTDSAGWQTYKPTQYGSTYGAGLHYSYAFNSNGFFIAPGIIFEQDSFNKTTTKGTHEDSLQVKNRYGAKIDVGYDVSEVVAPYLTGGYAAVSYKSVSNGDDGSGGIATATSSGTASNGFFGGGLKFTLSKSFSMNVEYNRQTFTAKSAIPKESTYYVNGYKQSGRLDIVKLGLSYNF
jgi:opacity protein-like surface antigen